MNNLIGFGIKTSKENYKHFCLFYLDSKYGLEPSKVLKQIKTPKNGTGFSLSVSDIKNIFICRLESLCINLYDDGEKYYENKNHKDNEILEQIVDSNLEDGVYPISFITENKFKILLE